MSSSVLSSQSVIITTAMAISGAVIFLSLSRIKILPSIQSLPIIHYLPRHSINSSSLRSCLSSERLKGENKKNKKKRVTFAEDVKEIYSKKKKNNEEALKVNKALEFHKMPANRAALYHGILRDRVHRVVIS